jgi:hypothetical protein
MKSTSETETFVIQSHNEVLDTFEDFEGYNCQGKRDAERRLAQFKQIAPKAKTRLIHRITTVNEVVLDIFNPLK